MPYCFNLDTKETLPELAVRELFPNLLLPENGARWFDATLPWVFVFERDPVFDRATHSATAIDPVKGEDGVYVQSWEIEALSQEVLDERAIRDARRAEEFAEYEASRAVRDAAFQRDTSIAALKRDLDAYFDSVAKEQGFDNGRMSLAVRAGYPNKWQALAISFGTWMDGCNDLADMAFAAAPLPTRDDLISTFTSFTFEQ